MRRLRTDLDGLRVSAPGSEKVWLIFHGMRHYIESAIVYDRLFCDQRVVEASDLNEILRGPDLNNGTCLARADDGPIYLIAGEPPNTRKYEIATWETFLACDFAISCVQTVPSMLLSVVPPARKIFVERHVPDNVDEYVD